MKTRLIIAWLTASLLTGCRVGPNYRRPIVKPPDVFRGGADRRPPAEPASPGDQKWPEVFRDQQLQELVRTALRQNYDARIAASRILQAQAQLRITRADQFPSVNAGANITSQRNPQTGPIPRFETTRGQVNLSASWELDFWGRYRRAPEAARAELLATEWARQAVIFHPRGQCGQWLFSASGTQFGNRDLKTDARFAQGISKADQDSGAAWNQFAARRAAGGAVGVHRECSNPGPREANRQQENAICILLGNNPGDIPRGLKLTEQPHAP